MNKPLTRYQAVNLKAGTKLIALCDVRSIANVRQPLLLKGEVVDACGGKMDGDEIVVKQFVQEGCFNFPTFRFERFTFANTNDRKANMQIKAVKTKAGYFVYYKGDCEKDKYEYFIRGEGWKKTKKFEVVDIEVPDTKDNWHDIAQAYEKYGKEICMRYLITNSAECWKETMLKLARKYKLTKQEQEALDKLNDYLGCHVIKFFSFMFYCCFEITKMDAHFSYSDKDYSARDCTYKGESEISMSDYVERKIGTDVKELIEKF